MPIFEYTGSDRSGTSVRARVDADSIKSAKQKVKKSGIVLLSIEERSNAKGGSFAKLFPTFSGGGSVNQKILAVTTRQFASLIKANIPLVEALAALLDQTENMKLKSVLADVRQQVNEGISLKDALGRHPRIFQPIFLNMVESGEASGTLPLVLVRLSEFMEAQVRLRSKISSAMTYPLIMMVVGGALMMGIFTFVIPNIANVFKGMNKKLPWYTELVMNISNFLVGYWWAVILGIALFTWIFRRYVATEKGRVRKDRVVLKLPLIGETARMIAMSRFASTLATLLNGGVPLVSAMGIVKAVVGNEIISAAIVSAREDITEGQSLTDPLRRSGEFPSLLLHMISIGERTGELPNMLEMVSKNYEEQINSKIETMTTLLEPLMIVVMGLTVGVVVMAVFMPLLDLQKITH